MLLGAWPATRSSDTQAAERAEAIDHRRGRHPGGVEAEPANVLERAARDADAIRQEARLEHPEPTSRTTRSSSSAIRSPGSTEARRSSSASSPRTPIRCADERPPRSLSLSGHGRVPGRRGARRDPAVRRAARDDRERFREELVALVEPPRPARRRRRQRQRLRLRVLQVDSDFASSPVSYA